MDTDTAFSLVPSALVPALRARGFTELTSVQEAVLAASPQGRDLRISSQTGSGKTVALGFLLARDRLDAAGAAPTGGTRRRALVITPTRELANQVRDELAWLLHGVPDSEVAVVTGGTSVRGEQALLSRRPGIVVGTPGRLLDHLRSGALEGATLNQVVLDEADRMLDMGFRDELEGVLDTLPPDRRTHLVSATFSPPVQRLASRYQRSPLCIEGTRLGEANLDIEHVAHVVAGAQRYDALVNLLLAEPTTRVLVFVRTRAAATELGEQLTRDGFAAQALSGDLAQVQRQRTVEAFRAGSARVLVATDVAARGLDVPEIGVVVHFDGPEDPDAYTHRSGRTGRAGRKGRSVLLVPPTARTRAAGLVRASGSELTWAPAPGVREVRAAQAAALERELATALAHPTEGALVARAEALLAQHEAPALVAALIARLHGQEPCEPRELAAMPTGKTRSPRETVAAPRAPQGAGPWRRDSAPDSPCDRSAAEAPRAPRAATSPHRSATAFTEFYLNWGARHGATPPRVLALACRRGSVPSGAIGAIRVAPNATTLEIATDVAPSFADAASRPDRIDPRLRFAPLVRPQPGATGSTYEGPQRKTSSSAHEGPQRNASSPAFAGPQRNASSRAWADAAWRGADPARFAESAVRAPTTSPKRPRHCA